MSRTVSKAERRGGWGTVAGRRLQRRRMRPTVSALEPRTLPSNLYVNSANSGTADGLTPATGFTTIQAGISIASTGDTILVETGHGYNESDTVGVAGLTIEADTGQHPVLDGTTPIAQASSGFTIIATGVTIAGFTIQNFSGPSAVLVQGGASITLSGETIQDNSASSSGGGIDNSGELTVTECTLTNNTAGRDGGGIYDEMSGTVSVTQSTLTNNTAASNGGGIDSESSGAVSITDTTIASNSAAGSGGGILCDVDTLSICDAAITNNTATIVGGGIFIGPGALTILNTTIASNSAISGGGVINFGTANLTDSIVTLNTADAEGGGGGGLYNNGTTTLSNCTVSDNSAGEGGGLFNFYSDSLTFSGGNFEANHASSSGGAIFNGGHIESFDSGFTGNSAGNAGGAYRTPWGPARSPAAASRATPPAPMAGAVSASLPAP